MIKVSVVIIVLAVVYNIVVVVDPLGRFKGVEELPSEFMPTYATDYCVSMGLPQPTAGYEWMVVGTWQGSDSQLLPQVLMNYQWAFIWSSGQLDERAADVTFLQTHPAKVNGRFAIALNTSEIGVTAAPGETGTVVRDDRGNLTFSVSTGNLGWTVGLYEMQPVHY